ncbi:MAG: hypothetical protein ACPF9I_05720 [Candidatus Thalassarchaeaceae archaeon]
METFEKAWSLVKEKRCEAGVVPSCTGEADFQIVGDSMDRVSGGYACEECIEAYTGDGDVYPLGESPYLEDEDELNWIWRGDES